MTKADYERLYATHSAELLKMICQRVDDYSTAEDLAQETWMRVWHTKSYKGNGSSIGYFKTIALNVIRRHEQKCEHDRIRLLETDQLERVAMTHGRQRIEEPAFTARQYEAIRFIAGYIPGRSHA